VQVFLENTPYDGSVHLFRDALGMVRRQVLLNHIVPKCSYSLVATVLV